MHNKTLEKKINSQIQNRSYQMKSKNKSRINLTSNEINDDTHLFMKCIPNIFLISILQFPINLNFSLVTSEMEKNTKSYNQFTTNEILTKKIWLKRM